MDDEHARASAPGGSEQEPKYGDFLLVDILHPDFRHFFSRYRTDLIGFLVIAGLVVFIIYATKWLAMIGAAGSSGQ